MKQLGCLFLLLTMCACSHRVDIRYANTSDGGCTYSEIYRPKRWLLDFFGRRDSDLYVNYAGVKCETIIKEELKDSIHKTPYNHVPVINERPPLKVDVEQN